MPDDLAPHGQPTYYGRPQLKASPFENWVVGGYIFLAGLGGAVSLISAALDHAGGGPAEARAATVRRGRYLALLAPLAAPLLVYDLNTPKRFYNMLRVAKRTSPMSIGTWILMGFSGFAGLSAAAQFLGRGRGRAGHAARLAHLPAAVAGAGLSTYTASLLAATSTPLWAAAPRALAIRFGASSMAAGVASLALAERSPRLRRDLNKLAVAALATELAATAASHAAYARAGVAGALDGPAGRAEAVGATALGTILPLGLHLAELLATSRPGRLSRLAGWAALAGSLVLRISIMEAGDASALRPELSLRFSQPGNLE